MGEREGYGGWIGKGYVKGYMEGIGREAYF